MTNNLDLTQLSPSQNNKETTINDTNAEIDSAITDVLVLTITSTNAATVTNAQLRRAGIVDVQPSVGDPPTGGITVTVPALSRGTFAVINQTAQTVTVTIAAQPVAAPEIPTTQTSVIALDGVNARLAGGGGGGGGGDTVTNNFLGPVIRDPFEGVLLTKSAAQSIPNDTDTTLSWDQETYDTLDFHSTTVNNSRITIAPGTSITRVILFGSVRFAADATPAGTRSVVLLRNGSPAAVRGERSAEAADVVATVAIGFASPPLDVAGGDFFELRVRQDSGAALDVEAVGATSFGLMVVDSDLSRRFVLATPGPFKGALLKLSADQSIPTGADTALSFANEDYDTDGFHESVTNPTRITIPNNLGIARARVLASVLWAAGATGARRVAIRQNGTTFVGGDTDSGAANEQSQATTPVLSVSDGDYFEAIVRQDSGGALNAVADAQTFLALEVVEGPAGAQPGFAQNWAVPFRGAAVSRSSTTTITGSTREAIPFNREDLDTDGFFDIGAPTRLTIPQGITKVRFSSAFRPASSSGLSQNDRVSFTLRRNGTDELFMGNSRIGSVVGFTTVGVNLVTAPISVTANDFYESTLNISTGAANYILDANLTWFAVEVLETTDSVLRPFDVASFTPGTPTASSRLQQVVLARAATLPADAINSRAFAGTAPSAAIAISILRNGASVGTVDFATSATTGTFTVASPVVYSAGDQLALVAPANLQGIADVSITLALGLST